MVSETTPYVKTLEDELDWKLLDQLSSVVLQISNFCFEIKKLCVTTEFIVLTLVVKFTKERLDNSLFVTTAMIAFGFWALDAIAYSYQVKLRGVMDEIRERLRSRQSTQIIGAVSAPVIEPERVRITRWIGIRNAIFNSSMFLYGILLIIDILVWILFVTGQIPKQ
jgi:hypothetical protein